MHRQGAGFGALKKLFLGSNSDEVRCCLTRALPDLWQLSMSPADTVKARRLDIAKRFVRSSLRARATLAGAAKTEEDPLRLAA
jgi:hypothetical protein